MGKAKSSFDSVQAHLTNKGAMKPMPPEGRGDLEKMLLRYQRVKEMGAEYAAVELSPYMESLLRVTAKAAGKSTSVRARFAASF